jgi:hypothetical protein
MKKTYKLSLEIGDNYKFIDLSSGKKLYAAASCIHRIKLKLEIIQFLAMNSADNLTFYDPIDNDKPLGTYLNEELLEAAPSSNTSILEATGFIDNSMQPGNYSLVCLGESKKHDSVHVTIRKSSKDALFLMYSDLGRLTENVFHVDLHIDNNTLYEIREDYIKSLQSGVSIELELSFEPKSPSLFTEYSIRDFMTGGTDIYFLDDPNLIQNYDNYPDKLKYKKGPSGWSASYSLPFTLTKTIKAATQHNLECNNIEKKAVYCNQLPKDKQEKPTFNLENLKQLENIYQRLGQILIVALSILVGLVYIAIKQGN